MLRRSSRAMPSVPSTKASREPWRSACRAASARQGPSWAGTNTTHGSPRAAPSRKLPRRVGPRALPDLATARSASGTARAGSGAPSAPKRQPSPESTGLERHARSRGARLVVAVGHEVGRDLPRRLDRALGAPNHEKPRAREGLPEDVASGVPRRVAANFSAVPLRLAGGVRESIASGPGRHDLRLAQPAGVREDAGAHGPAIAQANAREPEYVAQLDHPRDSLDEGAPVGADLLQEDAALDARKETAGDVRWFLPAKRDLEPGDRPVRQRKAGAEPDVGLDPLGEGAQASAPQAPAQGERAHERGERGDREDGERGHGSDQEQDIELEEPVIPEDHGAESHEEETAER